MSDWQRKLNLHDVWSKPDAGEMTIAQLAAVVADRLEALEPFVEEDTEGAEEWRLELVESFRMMADDPDLEQDEFNSGMEDLYDWADLSLDGKWNGKKVCWVNTCFSTA